MDKVPAYKADICCTCDAIERHFMPSEHRFAEMASAFCRFCGHSLRCCGAAAGSRVAGLFGPCRPGTRSKRGECRRSGGFAGGGITRSGGFTPPPQRVNAGSCGDVKSPLHLPCRVSQQSLYAANWSFYFFNVCGCCASGQATPTIPTAKFQWRPLGNDSEISIACEPYLC